MTISQQLLTHTTYIEVDHYGYDGGIYRTFVQVPAAVADEVAAIFKVFFDDEMPIEEVVDSGLKYGKIVNNQSFCHITDIKPHSFTLQVVINPIQNPNVENGIAIPAAAQDFINNRTDLVKGVIKVDSLSTQHLRAVGYTYGGDIRHSPRHPPKYVNYGLFYKTITY